MRVRWGRILIGAAAVIGIAVVCGLVITTALTLSDGAGFVDSVPDRPIIAEPDAPVVDRPDRQSEEVPEAPATPDTGDLPTFDVLTLQYTPYMATLALMDAQGHMESLGWNLRLHDVYAPEVDLDEEGQCSALQDGEYHALATTLDATRKCGEGVAVGIPIGQSAGNDAIVVKPGVETWNEVFEHAIGFTGLSVSEYMACFASHTANEPLALPFRYDDAAEAVDAWLNAGPEQDILSVVAWEPEISRALAGIEGSQVLLSSEDVRILWDVVEFSSALADENPDAYRAFTRAYYLTLADLTRNPEGAMADLIAWAEGDPAREALLTTTDATEFVGDLDNEAFATLRDAAFLMEDLSAIRNRLEEAGFYWDYCRVDVPEVQSLDNLIMPEFVLEARQDSSLLLAPNERPSENVFQVTDYTEAAAVTDVEIEAAQVLFETGIEIEFRPNSTDFRNPGEAQVTLADAVRFLRTCQDCLLEIQGGAAYPGEAVCPSCVPEDSDSLAIDRGRRVYDELRLRFDVPEAQLRFIAEPHPPQFPGSIREEELRMDRRTFLRGLHLAGR